MSQRKAKEYRRAMDQYNGVVEDVDDLKRRIGAMEARHRREDLAAEAKKRREAARMWANLQAESAAAERAAEEQKKVERHKRNERRRRELARRRIITLACAAVLLLAIVWAIATACTAQENEPEKEVTDVDPVVFVTPPTGEDPMEAEKIEAALLDQGYLSDAVPLSYDLQDIKNSGRNSQGQELSTSRQQNRNDTESSTQKRLDRSRCQRDGKERAEKWTKDRVVPAF